MNELKFPEGFWWGSATSAHQVEGNNNNDWSRWEQSDERTRDLELKGLNQSDYISGKACDSYNRYREDFDIAKQLNQNIHRFSIEWSRIEPEEGKFDSNAMQHYIEVVKALRDRGIEPMITLWHFTNPSWFAKKGGFTNINSPGYFIRYVKYVVDNLKNRVGLWITFNEATSVYAGLSYLTGAWPPQEKSLAKFIKTQNNFIKAHILAYQEIKKIYGMSHNIGVGAVENFSPLIASLPLRWLGINKIYNYFRNLRFWIKTMPYQDFIGLNYYTARHLPGIDIDKKDMAEEMGWEIYPRGIYDSLIELKRFKKPVFITENGIADGKDQKREKFIKDHLRWVWQAIEDGVDVKGYLYWSLLDNFEWAHGFDPRFGLVEMDYKTPERKIRPSALEYAKICLTNKLKIDL